jgi:hypothetical protein
VQSTHRITAADHAIRAIAVTTVSGLAGLAARISYQHMLLLAERNGEYGIDAHAFPLTVDGLDLIGVLVLLDDRRTQRRPGPLPWAVLAIGTLASLTANIAVAPDNVVARAISGWTAIALLAAAKMLSHLFEPQHTTRTLPNEPISGVPASDPEATTTPTQAQPTNARPSAGDIARRLPTSESALNRWRAIWAATRDLDTATADSAVTHGISLRTLQFIRAAGEAGHLDPPTSAALPSAAFTPADQTTEPNHHGTLTGAVA